MSEINKPVAIAVGIVLLIVVLWASGINLTLQQYVAVVVIIGVVVGLVWWLSHLEDESLEFDQARLKSIKYLADVDKSTPDDEGWMGTSGYMANTAFYFFKYKRKSGPKRNRTSLIAWRCVLGSKGPKIDLASFVEEATQAQIDKPEIILPDAVRLTAGPTTEVFASYLWMPGSVGGRKGIKGTQLPKNSVGTVPTQEEEKDKE